MKIICYKFIADNETLFTCEQVAVCYDDGDSGSVLLKHGSPTKVMQYADLTRSSYVKSGLTDIAQDIKVIVFPENFPTEEINKCLDICDYVGRLAKKLESQ